MCIGVYPSMLFQRPMHSGLAETIATPREKRRARGANSYTQTNTRFDDAATSTAAAQQGYYLFSAISSNDE